jgi:hypothetical protein
MSWKQIPQAERESRADPTTVDMDQASMFEASALGILANGLGARKSAERGVSMLGDERIIPMMSYGLVEYLMGLDLSGFDLLELGGGHSTEFWSQRVGSVVTFETDAEWTKVLVSRGFPNTEIRATTAHSIAADMRALGKSFDAVIIDASASRYACAKAALPLLKPGGFILLDNADWYPNTAALLRGADLIQVDFHDFRPLRWYRCATSLFLHKDFRARPRYGRLPQPLIGGKDLAAANEWDAVTA